METIKSFTVDHKRLLPGVYVSRTHHGKNHEFYHQSSRASAGHLCVTEGQSRRQHDHHLRYSYDKTEF